MFQRQRLQRNVPQRQALQRGGGRHGRRGRSGHQAAAQEAQRAAGTEAQGHCGHSGAGTGGRGGGGNLLGACILFIFFFPWKCDEM